MSLVFKEFKDCQTGCVGKDARVRTFQLAQPAKYCQLLPLRESFGVTNLDSELDSRRRHHCRERTSEDLAMRARSALVDVC
jgi:hypothetical protein